MLTLTIGGVLCYAPNIPDRAYAVTGLKLTSEINKAQKLTFTLPQSNRAYNAVNLLSSDVILRDDDEIVFVGRVLSTKRDFYNNKEVTCEGALAYLNDSIVNYTDSSVYTYDSSTKTGTYGGTTGGDVRTFVTNVLAVHNAQVGASRQIQMGHISASQADEHDETAIVIPGYVLTSTSPAHYTPEDDTSASGFLPISWFAARPSRWGYGATRAINMEAQGLCYELIQNKVNENAGVRFRYPLPANAYMNGSGETDSAAKIIVEAKQYKNSFDTLTGDWLSDVGYALSVRPEEENGSIVLYLDLLSQSGSQGEQEIQFGVNLRGLEEYVDATEIYTRIIPIGKNGLTIASVNSGAIYLENSTLAQIYGHIAKVINYNDIGTASQLKSAAQSDLSSLLSAALNLTIKAVDLTVTGDVSEAFYVGGWNRVISLPHGYDEFLQCTRIVRDLQDPGKDEYVFGVTRTGVSDTVAKLVTGK